MLYDECDIVILDDPFSSLDGRTEDQVINNLFGPEGIFHTRRSTVFWITNASGYKLYLGQFEAVLVYALF